MLKHVTHATAVMALLAAPVALRASSSDDQAKKAQAFTEQSFRNNMYIGDTPGDPVVLISTLYGPHAKLKSNGGEAIVTLSAGVTKPSGPVTYLLDVKVDYFGSRWAFIDAVTHDARGYPFLVKARNSKRQVIACFTTCKYEESFIVPITSADVSLALTRNTGMLVSFAGGGSSWQLTVPLAELKALKEAVDGYTAKQALSGTTIARTPKPAVLSQVPMDAGTFWRGALGTTFEEAKQKFPQHRLVTHQGGTSVVTGAIDEQFGVPLELALVFKGGKLASMLWGVPENAQVDANAVEGAYLKAVTRLAAIYTKSAPEKSQLVGTIRNRTSKFVGAGVTVDAVYFEMAGMKPALTIRADIAP